MKITGGAVDLSEISAPSTPPSNRAFVYIKSDGLMYWKDDAGTERSAGLGSSSKISALTGATTAALANELAINEAGTSKKLTVELLQDLIGVKKAVLASTHTISVTTATKCSMDIALTSTGTYVFMYYLVVQSTSATVSPMYGVNYTGTATKVKATCSYVDTGGLLTGTGTADDVGTTAGSMLAGTTVSTTSTTAPNMGHTGGVGTINADCLVLVEGMFVVSTTGTIEFWHGSETANSTSVMAGSSVLVTKMG